MTNRITEFEQSYKKRQDACADRDATAAVGSKRIPAPGTDQAEAGGAQPQSAAVKPLQL